MISVKYKDVTLPGLAIIFPSKGVWQSKLVASVALPEVSSIFPLSKGFVSETLWAKYISINSD